MILSEVALEDYEAANNQNSLLAHLYRRLYGVD